MQHSVEKEEDQGDRNIYFLAANKIEATNYLHYSMFPKENCNMKCCDNANITTITWQPAQIANILIKKTDVIMYPRWSTISPFPYYKLIKSIATTLKSWIY